MALIVAQAFQCFAYRFWLTRKIHDERRVIMGFAYHGHLPGQNGCWYEAQTDLSHLLAKARHDFRGNGQCRFGGHIAPRRAGATCSQHQIAANLIDKFNQRLFYQCLLIGDQTGFHLPRTAECL